MSDYPIIDKAETMILLNEYRKAIDEIVRAIKREPKAELAEEIHEIIFTHHRGIKPRLTEEQLKDLAEVMRWSDSPTARMLDAERSSDPDYV